MEYRIVRPMARFGGSSRAVSFLTTAMGRPQRVIGVNIDITERKRAEEHQRVLVAELDHRVKNVLATVSAVAAQTLEASSSMDHFVAALDGRIRSMATAHELLSARQWQGRAAGGARPARVRGLRQEQQYKDRRPRSDAERGGRSGDGNGDP